MKNRMQADAKEQDRLRKHSKYTNKMKSKTRPELAADTNINTILKKFGINAPQRQGIYGQTVDYNVDLALARTLVSEALDAYSTLPEKLRARYRTLEEFRRGIESGQIKPADIKDPRQLQLEIDEMKASTASGKTPDVPPEKQNTPDKKTDDKKS